LGGGGNGKGTLLDTIIALLGKENVSAVSLQDLAENRFRVAELHGKLANIFADLDNRALNSSSTFKTLVTGDLITAERKFGQPFSFRSHARLIFSTNNLPQNTDRTHAFYRRQLVIPFKRTFTEIDADLELRVRLRTELPGILNVALRGLRRLFSQGHFSDSPAVKAEVEEYRRQNDSVAAFCAEHVVNDPNGTIEKAKFYSEYKLWCESEELRPDSQTRLKSSMKRIFPKLDEIRSSRGRCSWHWKGISLKGGT
jgi:putative DNA primase/helicase